MFRIFFSKNISLAAMLLCLYSSLSTACDQNESCGTVCVHPALFGCLQTVKDSLCEARKAACRLNPVIADSIFQGPLREGSVIPSLTIERCISDQKKCFDDLAGLGGYEFLRPYVDAYLSDLDRQASGNYKSLPNFIIAQLQPYFSVDLSRETANKPRNLVLEPAFAFAV